MQEEKKSRTSGKFTHVERGFTKKTCVQKSIHMRWITITSHFLFCFLFCSSHNGNLTDSMHKESIINKMAKKIVCYSFPCFLVSSSLFLSRAKQRDVEKKFIVSCDKHTLATTVLDTALIEAAALLLPGHNSPAGPRTGSIRYPTISQSALTVRDDFPSSDR